jgi:hypothetical protein
MLDQTAKLHRLYRLGKNRPREIRINRDWSLKAFQQLVVEVVAVSQAEPASGSFEALIGAQRVNAEDVAH